MRRVRARVEGTVQGVGFRPFVYRLASELDLAGFVLNDERGVLLEVEGGETAVDGFLRRLSEEAPPLAAIEAVRPRDVAPAGERGFRILASPRGGEPAALVSPDTATCEDCLAELCDPSDRRHRYPFINCTNCGPRFTIVRGVPYDRPQTTMAGFEMCPRCAAEYEDPADRRFHAQPNACPECGPTLRLLPGDHYGDEALRGAVAALRDGAVVAVKGIGGYHLACLAAREPAVAALRARKHREDKPFAVMVRDVAAARELVVVTDEEASLLAGRDRPIVLAPRLAGAAVAASVAPRSADLGVLLPYSPLHHLLLADVGEPLVMTSGNVSEEPIAHVDEDALERLAGIADLVLFHDRPIHTRTDDSVLRAVPGRRPLLMRRSRGFVPDSLALPVSATRHVLACGAELKSTFCVAKGERAWVGHHIGDLKSYEVLQAFEAGIEHFERLFAVLPEVVVHDEHPDYLSTRYALAREGVETVAVQHHHAHLVACLAEHGETGPAVGAIYDGTGYGSDGTVWGGELLVGGLDGFERVGHLWPVRLPGGDRAVRQPWRMACAWLLEAGWEGPLPAPDRKRGEQVAELVRTGLSSPVTTSMGRLFDAVAALCGLRSEVTYEGQAAIELEAAADPDEHGEYDLPVTAEGVLDARAAVLAAARDVAAGAGPGAVSARFHAAVATATAEAVSRAGLDTAVLSGGVFQNRTLLAATASRLEARGLRVLVPERLPPNDGGVSYGQAAVAAWRQRARTSTAAG
ncbi:MAG: hydrogenase maturation protein HypF [Solirubrobacteraceae bacterium]|nr:hydrogenase maturation protein HypF [Solirubrobacteraceae bacterium]